MKHWQPSLVTTDWLVQEVPLLRQVTPAELAIKGGLGIGVVFTKSSSYLSVNGDDWDNTAYDESDWMELPPFRQDTALVTWHRCAEDSLGRVGLPTVFSRIISSSPLLSYHHLIILSPLY